MWQRWLLVNVAEVCWRGRQGHGATRSGVLDSALPQVALLCCFHPQGMVEGVRARSEHIWPMSWSSYCDAKRDSSCCGG